MDILINVLRSEHLNSGTLLPVVVWIYGGANVAGSVEFYGPIETLVATKGYP